MRRLAVALAASQRAASARTNLRRVSVLAAIVALATVAASPARAHAQLEEASPAAGAVLERVPETVFVRFTDSVSVVSGSLRVFDSQGRRVDIGTVQKPGDRELRVRLRGGLPDDVYTVAWKAISSDSHPIRGAYAFTVGTQQANTDGIADEVFDDESSTAVDAALAITRYLGLALILLCVGGATILAFVVDPPQQRSRVLWSALAVSAGLLVLASLAWIALTGVQAVGLGLDAVFTGSLFRDVVETGFGRAWLIRAVLAAALAVLAVVSARRRTERGLVAAVFLASAIGVTPALSGHARTEGVFAMTSDAVHTLAAGAWVGGLAFLSLLLVTAGGDRWSLAASVVPRFSTVALVSVAALVAAGVGNSIVQVGSVQALWETTYGRLLLAKVALVVPLLLLGAYNNRRAVPGLRAGAPPAELRRRFSRAIATELAIMALIVGVTSALVAEPPARAQATTSDGEISGG